jgi:hypothetical protein
LIVSAELYEKEILSTGNDLILTGEKMHIARRRRLRKDEFV